MREQDIYIEFMVTLYGPFGLREERGSRVE